MAIFDRDFAQFFLEQMPRAAYESAAKPFGGTPQRRRFLDRNYDETFNQYLGQLGGQAREGFVPDLNWGDFTQNFDFNRAFYQSPREQRGDSERQFNPNTRFLYGF